MLAKIVGPGGHVLGVDIQKIDPLAQENVSTVEGDMTQPETHVKIHTFLEKIHLPSFHVITSDVAPKTTGRNDDDQYHSATLCLEVLKIADKFLCE